MKKHQDLHSVLMRGVHPNRRGASLSLFHFHPTINEFRVGRSLIKELSASGSGRCERLDERGRGGYKSRSNRNQLFATFLMEWEASMLQQAYHRNLEASKMYDSIIFHLVFEEVVGDSSVMVRNRPPDPWEVCTTTVHHQTTYHNLLFLLCPQ